MVKNGHQKKRFTAFKKRSRGVAFDGYAISFRPSSICGSFVRFLNLLLSEPLIGTSITLPPSKTNHTGVENILFVVRPLTVVFTSLDRFSLLRKRTIAFICWLSLFWQTGLSLAF